MTASYAGSPDRNTPSGPGPPALHHSGEPGELIIAELRYTVGAMVNGLCA
jgi:hypothetical protein